jgi:hypothetical protein
MTRAARLLCAWSGPLFVVLFFTGFVLLAHFVPPPSPHETAQQIAALFRDHTTRIRFGMAVCMFGVIPLIAWGCGVAAHTRTAAAEFPALVYIQVGCVAIGTLTGVIDMTIWAVAAFRPQQTSAQTLLLLNDIGWFLFLFAISPFCLWLLTVGIAILTDGTAEPVFPRWLGFLSLWAALLSVPAGLILFFKHGPFAWNGLIAFYIPLVVFFVWLVAINIYVFRELYRQPAGHAAAIAGAPAGSAA